ncbi:MAG: AAA family ATPase [Candidatus Omnitrophica bacterium]|nr:AAA family ATPase [Candidatus Omnitrophota bacterium]
MISIGIAGKGGTGKTTVSALVLLTLKRAGKVPLLAVDADPSSNFCEVIGVKTPPSLVSVVDDFKRSLDKLPAGIEKNQFLEYQIRQAISENPDFDVLLMGRTEGPGCYCYANHLLREHLQRLEKNYRFVVIDNEAGLEHLSRRTTRCLDFLLVTTITTRASLSSAEKVLSMVEDKNLDLKIGQTYLVINEMAGKGQDSFGESLGLPCFRLPFDTEILRRSELGIGLLDLPDTSVSLQSIQANLLPLLDSLERANPGKKD